MTMQYFLLLLIAAPIAVFCLLVYSILNHFYAGAPRKLKIEASLIIGFIAFLIFSSRSLMLMFVVLLILGLAFIRGYRKLKQ